MRIAVTGARGQLGAALVHELAPTHDVTALGHAELDVTDEASVAKTMDALRPNAIINAAAYNDVDGAEDQPIVPLNLNAFAVRALARAATSHGATLIHYSSDFVFDGRATSPYTEEDRPSPQSVYATSKLLGEWFAMDAPRAYVLRVESLFGRAPGGPAPKGSIGAMTTQLRAGGEVRAFEDRTVSPTYVLDAARATRELLESDAPGGLYHCVNSDACTWLEFAHELARLLGGQPRIVPVRMADVTLKAARPMYCALSNEKLRAAGVDMPTWRDALERYIKAL